ncbi:MAG: CopG family transcriptional regulator [Deltaproteobacteria bacterium]|nr:CopG family transcriptional regulator [Deltaproteobacteria bacterium]
MIRIQLHLSEAQDRQLRRLARRTGSNRAELIRRGVDLLLRTDTSVPDPLLALVGAAGPAGRPDVSERHDELLYAADPAAAAP